jgi:hypothetical protein
MPPEGNDMTHIDATGIIDILVDICRARHDSLSVRDSEGKTIASFIRPEGDHIAFEITTGEYSSEVTFDMFLFNEKKLTRWLVNLEYEFEQRYRVNIRITTSISGRTRRVSIAY